jgi:hypothetical protein
MVLQNMSSKNDNKKQFGNEKNISRPPLIHCCIKNSFISFFPAVSFPSLRFCIRRRHSRHIFNGNDYTSQECLGRPLKMMAIPRKTDRRLNFKLGCRDAITKHILGYSQKTPSGIEVIATRKQNKTLNP